ncbi:putative sulfate exporter family transporter [Deinococcus metallilatus]|uniref:Integral membrane protein (TIGR00698 family) n=1 Tax=Deinococcus metallilatus TaxID=1211322 RepID=A0AAJ5JXB3_9DEIO|nr:putative sulfate exporter family transporter [Deinococcus metallilatus]MBB5295375.1 putative integral membrane protein (TIGR00698 family) [Deinococcus metallilatus]QBY08095.1 putative sulfate exporter family transporter [Deinococcus metallilatus]RXJ12430.1 putative sulfate exporter family transporter [Deinococcus metallilatus]TLK21087.1 putative sulfate exporter family transporter [Deinococcus metallilatus]GMA16052.1 membrane protein [Deinococcus metallilatus]
MSKLTSFRSRLPGLALVALLTAAAYLLSMLPGLRVLGALGLALLLGLAVRGLFRLPPSVQPGAGYAARTLLRLGVVLLGVRLNFVLFAQAGVRVLLLDLAVIATGLLSMTWLARRLGLPRGLGLAVAVGSSICGASAIAAAAPVVQADEDEVSVAVAVCSLLGTVGVVGYSLLALPLGLSAQRYGLMTGSSLHEIAQVLAAGAAQGSHALDFAMLTKLTRVALLAPVLLLLGGLLARKQAVNAGTQAARPPLLPPFLVGFLLVGVVSSTGLLPRPLTGAMQTASLLLTAASMAGIGLGVDFAVLRRLGGPALVVGSLGFGLLVLVAFLGTR